MGVILALLLSAAIGAEMLGLIQAASARPPRGNDDPRGGDREGCQQEHGEVE